MAARIGLAGVQGGPAVVLLLVIDVGECVGNNRAARAVFIGGQKQCFGSCNVASPGFAYSLGDLRSFFIAIQWVSQCGFKKLLRLSVLALLAQ